jgi:hypothetical protein
VRNEKLEVSDWAAGGDGSDEDEDEEDDSGDDE